MSKEVKKEDLNKETAMEKESSKKLSFFKICVHDVLEVLGVLFAVISFAFALSAIVLRDGGISLDFAKADIEESINLSSKNSKISIGNLTLSWQDLSRPLLLDVEEINIAKKDGQPLFNIKNAYVELHIIDLLRGKVSLRSLYLEEPVIRALYMSPRKIVLGFEGEAYEIPSEHSDDKMDESLLEKIIKDPSILSLPYKRLERVFIDDLMIKFVHFNKGYEEEIIADTLDFYKDDGRLKFDASLILPEKFAGDERMNIEASIDKKQALISANMAFKDIDVPKIAEEWLEVDEFKNISGALSGKGSVNYDSKTEILKTTFDLAVPKLSVNTALYSQDKDIKEKIDGALSIKGNSSHHDNENIVNIDNLSLDEYKATLSVTHRIKDEQDSDSSNFIDLKASLNSIETETLDDYWPKPDTQSTGHSWVVDRIRAGVVENVDLTFALKQNEEGQWDANFDDIQLGFDVKGGEIQYLETLPIAKDIVASGAINGKALSISVQQAKLGNLTLKENGGHLYFDDLITKGAGNAILKFQVAGDMPELLNFLSNEPVNIKRYLQTDFSKTKGTTDVEVLIQFPTVSDLRNEDVQINAKAEMNNIYLPDMVADSLDVSGGPFTLVASRDDFIFSGKGALDGEASDIIWHQYMEVDENTPYSQKLEAKKRVNSEFLKAFELDVSEFSEDYFPVDITYIKRNQKDANLNVKADLTPAKIKIDALSYTKESGQKGHLNFNGKLLNNKLVELTSVDLSGPELSVKGKNVTFLPGFIIPRTGTINEFKVGKTVAEIKLNQNEEFKDTHHTMDVSGALINAGGFLNTQKGGLKELLPPFVVRLKANQLILKNDQIVQDAELLFKQEGNGRIGRVEMIGNTGGKPLEVRFTPDQPDNPERLIVKAGNAGATLRALGLFETMIGGRINIQGIPVIDGLPQEVSGRMYISDFKIVDTPFLASLLNALSVEGFLQLLEENSLSFLELKSDFRTRKNDQGQWVVEFKDGKTKGSSLGLTFNGRTNIDAKTLDIKGEIIPASALNTALGKIPVIGEILSGGKDSAIFAANYSIKGADKNPKVSINPLSALAPGFLRRFLFDNDVDDDNKPVEQQEKKRQLN